MPEDEQTTTGEAAPGPTRLAVLRAARLKGATGADELAAAVDAPADAVSALAAELVADGLLREVKGERLRLTPEGKETLAGMLAEERASVDGERIAAAYAGFEPVNDAFKRAVTDWQQKDGRPNDHADAGYDARVLAAIEDVDARLRPLLDDVVAAAPRLAPYPRRLASARDRVRAGDHAWLLRPTVDSYHTVWFELHEELIHLAGLDRGAEAAAGRAD